MADTWTLETITKKVIALVTQVAEEQGITCQHIDEDKAMVDDLGLASLDIAALVAHLEIAFKVDPFTTMKAAITDIRTIRDLCQVYHQCVITVKKDQVDSDVTKPASVLPIPQATKPRTWHLLALSAKSSAELVALCQQYAKYIQENPQHALNDICYTVNTANSHFDYRIAIVANNRELLLRKLTDKKIAASITPVKRPAKIAFLFTGQGSQYSTMGKLLYDTHPTFKTIIDECAKQTKEILAQPLLDVIFSNTASHCLNQTQYTQPALFVLEYALAILWQQWGVKPDVVIGHSVGEITAATIAGLLSLKDGLRLITKRASLMQDLPQGGGMLAVRSDEKTIVEFIKLNHSAVDIAAINGPKQVVLSGKKAHLNQIKNDFAQKGIIAMMLDVSHAFHSKLMEPILEPFGQVAETMSYQQPSVGLISNLTGDIINTAGIVNAAYWSKHIRSPVRFYSGMQKLLNLDCRTLIEIGPHPILLPMAVASKPIGDTKSMLCLPSLRKNQDDWQVLLTSIGQLYTQGYAIDWDAFEAPYQTERMQLKHPVQTCQ